MKSLYCPPSDAKMLLSQHGKVVCLRSSSGSEEDLGLGVFLPLRVGSWHCGAHTWMNTGLPVLP